MRIWIFLFFSGFCLHANAQLFTWDCYLTIQDKEIYFQIERESESTNLFLINGNERIQLDAMKIEKDSAEFTLSVFDASLKIPFPTPNRFSGFYIRKDAKVAGYRLPFRGEQQQKTHQNNKKPAFTPILSRWKIEFLENEMVSDSGFLIMTNMNGKLLGTILTETGDYRYLNGQDLGGTAFLQTFDGAHTYFVELNFNDSKNGFTGTFIFNKTTRQRIRGSKSEKNFLSDGFKQGSGPNRKFQFKARNAKNEVITESDPSLKNRALVVQVLGTWCPNCLDETRFLVEQYPNRPPGLEFIGLAFERKKELEYAFSRIDVVKNKLNATYPIYWAGIANKDSASNVFSMNPVITSFPTTIFVRKDGSIAKIHSGFSGPATGEFYQKWKEEFAVLIREITEQ